MNPRSAALPIRSLRTLLLRTLLLCAPPALGLALGGCGSSAFKAETTQSSSVADGKSLFVSTDNGRVELIRDATAAEVRIEAKVRCTGATQAEADERLAKSKLVAVRDDAGCVRVSVEFPERAGSSWGWQSDSASITVRAADLSGIEVVTSNGSIVSGGFSGTATLVTSNGRISVDGHDGPVVARSSNGAITVSGVRSLTARTSNGRIDATLADGSAGDVDLDSSNGSVLLVLPASWKGVVTAETSNGSVDLKGGAVRSRVGRGSMTVGDAAGASAKATIDTSNGRVQVRVAGATDTKN